jgi:hypothetical protein
VRYQVFVDGEDRTALYAETLVRMKLLGLRNQINRRFDRCCHPGKPGDGALGLRRMFREYKT